MIVSSLGQGKPAYITGSVRQGKNGPKVRTSRNLHKLLKTKGLCAESPAFVDEGILWRIFRIFRVNFNGMPAVGRVGRWYLKTLPARWADNQYWLAIF